MITRDVIRSDGLGSALSHGIHSHPLGMHAISKDMDILNTTVWAVVCCINSRRTPMHSVYVLYLFLQQNKIFIATLPVYYFFQLSGYDIIFLGGQQRTRNNRPLEHNMGKRAKSARRGTSKCIYDFSTNHF